MSISEMTYTQRSSLRRTLLMFSLALVIVPALVFTGVGALVSYRSALQSARSQLSAAADLEQRTIERWVGERESDLGLLADQPALQQAFRTMRESPEGSSERLAAHSDAAARLNAFLNKKVAFTELMLLDPETSVTLVATDKEREGDSHFLTKYFNEGRERVYVQSPLYNPVIHAPAMLIARPVEGADGEVLAVLVGQVNLTDVGSLIQTEAQLGRTGETYLVSKERLYLAGTQEDAAPEVGINSPGIGAALGGEEGVGQYANYKGDEVLGAYRWLPTMKVALLVEQGRSEVVAVARRVVLTIVGVAVVAAALALGAALLLVRRVVNPIVDLTEAAAEIAAGDLERTAPVRRGDEIGVLAQSFNSMTARLRELVGSLEQRVADRTRELQENLFELESAAQIARQAASIRDVDQLLDETVHLISVLLGFYHTGIFLLDDAGEYAVLRATSSEGGRRMLERGHQLRVGREGIVGYVAESATSRIALDVGEDAVHFSNPDLPRTHSEMAVPLEVRGEVIGVLDVQSEEVGAFTDQDVAIIKTLADQIALAIENARLVEESQRTLRELETLYGRQTREAWRERASGRRAAYYYTRVGVESVPLSATPEVNGLVSQGDGPVIAQDQGDDGRQLSAPIRLRGQTIGSLVLRQDPEEEPWSPEELALLDELSTQIALALENARLLEATQRRAARERLTSEVTARIRASLDLESVLRTAADEMYQALGLEEVVVRLATGETGGGAFPEGAAASDGNGKASQEETR